MFPRTLPLLVFAALLALSACGTPPGAEPDDQPYTPPSYVPPSATAPAVIPTTPTTTPATLPTTVQPLPTYTTATNPPPATTGPETIAATPTPSHAPKCTGSPSGAQIVALVKGQPNPPPGTLKVRDGPFCAGGWSFTTVEVAGQNPDELDPLMVVATGSGATLTLIGAGSDVCSTKVQTGAPAGIRVLACGF